MNNIYFIIAQILGIEALLLLVISYRKKETNEILIVQAISSLCYVVHYFLLGAFSGLFTCFIDFIRDMLYFKTDKDKLLFFISIPFYILVGIFSYNRIIDILPIIACIIDGYILTKNRKTIIIGSIICWTLWLTYDFVYMSYSGVLTSLIIIVSNLSILIFKKKSSSVILKANRPNRK